MENVATEEFISRTEALEDFESCNAENPNWTPQRVKTLLLRQPAADVAEVVHVQWISFLDGDHIMPERYYRCSRCGRVESRRQPYCHCGAKMDGAAE